ncbi:MAG: hypothetical protein DSY59_03680 [Persephonella sp.]|nr:MAG: hypothetical protein DSY60_01920 [Persephonella sp.]RUM60047.1 MAG: hypothetical protein DSY59_03680 [Persephonella sp.]
MKKILILIIFLVWVNLSFGGNETSSISVPLPPVPDTTSLVVKLFYLVMGAIFSYWLYFAIKNYMKYILIALSIYTVSLILLDYFNVIKLNIRSIKDYINELLVIVLYFYGLIQSKLSFTLGVIIGIIYALQKDNKIDIPQLKKGGGGKK